MRSQNQKNLAARVFCSAVATLTLLLAGACSSHQGGTEEDANEFKNARLETEGVPELNRYDLRAVTSLSWDQILTSRDENAEFSGSLFGAWLEDTKDFERASRCVDVPDSDTFVPESEEAKSSLAIRVVLLESERWEDPSCPEPGEEEQETWDRKCNYFKVVTFRSALGEPFFSGSGDAQRKQRCYGDFHRSEDEVYLSARPNSDSNRSWGDSVAMFRHGAQVGIYQFVQAEDVENEQVKEGRFALIRHFPPSRERNSFTPEFFATVSCELKDEIRRDAEGEILYHHQCEVGENVTEADSSWSRVRLALP